MIYGIGYGSFTKLYIIFTGELTIHNVQYPCDLPFKVKFVYLGEQLKTCIDLWITR